MMRKSELRALRTLNATKEMIEKAKVNEEEKRVKTHWGEKTVKRKYHMFLRCQNLGVYLKVAVFSPKKLAAGDNRPIYEIFINPDGEEYITRELEDGKEVNWLTSKIDNLQVHGNGWEGRYYSEEVAYINPEGRKNIRTRLKTVAGGYDGILEFQRRIREEKIKQRERREQQPWDEDMALVPPEPKRFEKWWKKEGISEQFMFYDYGRKVVKGYCSYCEKEVPIKESRHNKPVNCPCCKKEMVFKTSGKISTLSTCRSYFYLIQEIPEGFVVRKYEARRYYKGKNYRNPQYAIQEQTRVLKRHGIKEGYAWEMYKNKYLRWCKANWVTSYGYYRDCKTYPYNMSQLSKTVFAHSALPILVKKKEKIAPLRYLEHEEGNSAIEPLIKIGMLRMALGLIEIEYRDGKDLLDPEEKELAKILKIDTARLNRLKIMDGGVIHLRWMQKEKQDNTLYPDEMMRFFSENLIRPEILEFIHKRMSYVKIYNYIKRQQSGTRETAWQVVRTWQDYMNMAKKLHMPLNEEMVYKPKQLKAKHDELVLLLAGEEIKKQARQREKEFPKMKKVFPKLEKYEYQDKAFCIVAPKGVEDIIKEGTALSHCIHTCDYYFDRINRQESYILFLRRADTPGTSWYTLEVEPGGNIRQKRTTGDNQNEDFKEAVKFLKKWQKEIQKRLTKEDKKLAETSNQKRLANYEQIRKEKKTVWHGKLAGKLLADVLEADFMEVSYAETS